LLVIVPRRLRAPAENGAILAEPPLMEIGALIGSNRKTLSQLRISVFGRRLTTLRQQARQTIVALAENYLRAAGEPVSEYGHEMLLMAGHQPELVHPGVWIKHFALNRLARKYGATPVHIVVDNDTAKSCVIRFPVLAEANGAGHHLLALPFDQWTGEVPFEERVVNDETLFASLPDRAAAIIRNWSFSPLLAEFWQEVLAQASRTPLLGERLAAARRSLERQWGCHNLEIPVSHLCNSEPFAWFACHLLSDVVRFHATYNDCVHEYRRQYGIRSRNHPVPDLGTENGWYELPFWSWRRGQLARRRLMARPTATAIELRSGNEPWPKLPAADDGERVVAAFQELQHGGYKVRSRALTNTLFARLFLADLFIHGIGGAKYDELTDEIIRRFYGFDPPGYMVLSATLRLPLPVFQATPGECRRYAAMLRDVHFNPQRHLPASASSERDVKEATEQKQSWIALQPRSAAERRQRFEMLRALNRQLEPYVRQETEWIRRELTRCERESEANTVLQRRDYVFCLFPDSILRPFCMGFLSNGST
jgi:hypothetical protein